MPVEEKVLSALIRFGLDKQAIEQVKAGTLTVEDALKRVEAHSRRVEERATRMGVAFKQLDIAGRSLERAGSDLQNLGRLISSEFLTRLGEAASGIGNIASTVVDLRQASQGLGTLNLPGLGKLSTLGVGAAVAGGIGLGAGIYDAIRSPGSDDAGTIVKKGIASLQYGVVSLFEGSERASEAFQQTAENYGLIETRADKANRELEQTIQKFGSASAAFVAVAGPAARLAQILQGGLLGAAGQGLGTGLTQVIAARAKQDPGVQEYIRYQRSLEQLETRSADETAQAFEDAAQRYTAAAKRYNDAVRRTNEDYEKETARAETAFQKRRAALTLQFAESEADFEAAYYADRLKRAADFGVAVRRMEEDHQRQMRRLAEDHGRTLRRLANQRDALGILDEMETYETGRRRAEEDYQVNAARRNEDYARQLAEMEATFAAQRQKRREDQERRLAEMQTEFNEQRQERAADHQARLEQLAADLKTENDEIAADREKKLQLIQDRLDDERQVLRNDFQLRLTELGYFTAQQQTLYANWLTGMTTQFNNWVATNPIDFSKLFPGAGSSPTSPSGPKGKQSGGYAFGPGLYALAENRQREFVLNAGTTRELERLAGRSLDQDAILAMASGRSGGSGGVSISVAIDQSFGTAGSPEQYRRIAYETTLDVMHQVISQIKRS